MSCKDCPPGPLTDLCTTLTGMITPGQPLTITATTIPSQAVQDLFDNYLLNTDLVLDNPSVGFPPGLCSQLQMLGTTTKDSALPGLSISATFTLDTSQPTPIIEMKLIATLPEGSTERWTLSQVFLSLAGTAFDDVPITSPQLTLDSSAAQDQQFQFSGTIPLVPLEVAPLFGNVSSIDVSGFITAVAQTGPTFGILSGNTLVIPLGGLFKLAPQITLTVSVEDGKLTPSVGVTLTISVGDKSLPVISLLPFPSLPKTCDFSNQGSTLDFAFEALSTLTGLDFTSLMPTQIDLPGNFGLNTWDLSLNLPSLSLASFSLEAGTGAASSWPILSNINLESLTFTFSDNPDKTPAIAVTVGGTLTNIGGDAVLALTGSGPDFAFSGSLQSGQIDLQTLVSTFSSEIGSIIPKDLAVTTLSFSVATSSSTYQFDAGIEADWPIAGFTIKDVSLSFSDTAGVVTAMVSGKAALDTSPPTSIAVNASYDPDGWTFTGTLDQLTSDQLASLLEQYFPALATVVGSLDLTINSLSVTLPPTPGYTFALDVTWKIPIAGDTLEVDATINLQSDGTNESGTIDGSATYDNSLPLTVDATIADDKLSTITLGWSVAGETFSAEIGSGDTTATFHFKSLNIGELVTGLAEVTSPGYALTPPWDLLNSVDLPEFTVEIDFTTKQATLTIDIGTGGDFVFVDIESVAMTVDWVTEGVSFSIPKGTFLGHTISEDGLGWDVVPPADGSKPKPAPAVPGVGSSLFDLQFLALAQHFAPSTPISTSSITAALADLRSAFNSPTPGDGVQYSASTDWIVGVNASLLKGTVSIGALFYDPGLYGLSVNVGASDSSPLSQLGGLEFEILYKKISPGLGVYQTDVTLPDSIRNIQLGAVSVTLPSIGVSVYTNGDFLIDIGFPKNGDFSRSFTLQWLPFTGSGGFYFGILPAAAVPAVPQTSLGTFNPVVVFGVGVQVGIGKTVTYGILSGGLTLTVQGIIEGVFATFNPTGGSAGSGDLFYSVSGQVSIVGHLYGEINFVVISARFDVLISVGATVQMAAYQAVLLNVSASVEVSLTASINLGLFSISVDLSFSKTISEQFTIGSSSQAPWETPLIAAARLRRIGRPTSDVTLQWAPVTSDPAQPVALLLVPNPTAASPVDGTTLGPAAAQLVMMTYVDYTAGDTAPDTPSSFATLAEGILLWAVSAGVSGGKTVSARTILDTTVTQDQINGIFDALPTTPFQWSNIEALFADYFTFTIVQTDGTPQTVSVVPILPVLSMAVPNQPVVDFGAFNTVSAAELAKIQAEFAQLQPGVPFAEGGGTPGNTSTSVATFLFVDYITMLCKGVLQAASDLLTEPMTVGDIVDQLNEKLQFDAIAPQAARVFLQGLRPPWPAPSDSPQSIYFISGQELDASTLTAGDTITLFVPDDAPWLSGGGEITILIDGLLASILQALNGSSISPAFTSAAAVPLDVVAQQFTLIQPALWTGPDPDVNWTVYTLPSGLVQILDANPQLGPVMELGELDSEGATVTPPSTFLWMTSFPLEVALIPSAANPSTPLANTYNVLGTDAVGGAYLQALLEASAGDEVVPIEQIFLAYPTAPGSPGLTSAPVTPDTQFFVVQTNLSTESNPGDEFFSSLPPAAGVDPVNQKSMELLQFLWACSVVRSGGYFLFYKDSSGNGLPSSLFDADGNAELTIIVTYLYAPIDPMQTFLSGLVVTEPIDPANNLYLQAVSSETLVDARDTTLRELARRSRKTAYQVARRNKDVPIAAGTEVLVPRVRGAAAESVRLDRSASLAEIAQREGVSLARLANANRDRRLAFESQLTIDPILLTNAQTMNAGCAGFIAEATPVGGDGNDAQSILDQQYQLLGYQIAATSAFVPSPSGLPLSPATSPDNSSDTVYRATIPVAPFATDPGVDSKLPGQPPPAADPYRGIGQDVQFALNWQDVFGNVITTNPPAGGADPYTVTNEILYFDNLIALSQWPAIGMSYTIAPTPGGAAQLSIALTFQASRYDGASSELLLGDQAAFAAIYYQIARNVTITAGSTLDPTLAFDVTSDLVAFVVQVYAYITAIIDNTPPALPTVPPLTTPIKDTSGQAFFELDVTVTIARAPDLIEPAGDDPLLGAIASVTTPIRPAFQAPPGQTSAPATLLQFATDLNEAFPTLMLGVGVPDSTAATQQAYIVRFGEGGYAFTFGDPVYFALPPLALAPLSLTGVSILQYSSGTPIGSAQSIEMAFSNVNLDQLASSFLSSVDLFLSPDVVVPAWNSVAKAEVDDNPIDYVLIAKEALAAAIAALLQPPLASQTSATSTLPAAVAKLEQELLIQLSAAYQINTIVTVPVTPTVPSGAPEISLYGKPAAAAGSTGVFGLSNASLPLGAADPPTLAFTFSTSDPQDASLVDLTASYSINNCQFGFQAMLPPLSNYTASSWLTFGMPFSSASPAVQDAVSLDAPLSLGIPVPLRAFPTTPSISSQAATQVPLPPSPTPVDTRLWTYSFTYDYVAASQDDIHAAIAFTPPPGIPRTANQTVPAFAQALLQFSVSWPLLLPDISSSDAGIAANAMTWLSTMAQTLADTWASLAPPSAPPSSDFVITSDPGPQGQLQISISITSDEYPFGQPWIEIEGFTTQLVDEVFEFEDPDGNLLAYEQALMLPSRTVLVTPPDGVPCDVLVQPIGWAAVSVARNETYETEPGNPSFIYSTPVAQQVTPAVPLLEVTSDVDVAASTSAPPPQSLQTYLDNFLGALFTTFDGRNMAPQTIKLTCGYRYEIAPGLDVTVPILITTPMPVSPGDALVQDVVREVEAWLPSPAAAGARLVFGVSLFGAGSLPLVQIDSAVLPLSDLTTS